MEKLLVTLWFLLIFLIPASFAITAVCRCVIDNKIVEVVLRTVAAVFIFIMIITASIPFMFVVVYAGAHSNPVGNGMNFKGQLILLAFISAYLLAGYLLCSLVNGRLLLIDFLKRSRKLQ